MINPRVVFFTGLVLAAGSAAPTYAQGLLGQPVDVTYKVFQSVTDFGTQTIEPSGNDFSLSDNAIMVTVTPTQIVYSLSPGHLGVGNTPTSYFVGYIATETGSDPANIVAITIDPKTTATGFTSTSISSDATDVFANFGGTNFDEGQSLVLDINPPATVPEPSGATSLGLLMTLAASMVIIAVRKK